MIIESKTIIVSCDLCQQRKKNGIPDVDMTEIDVPDRSGSENNNGSEPSVRHICENCKMQLLREWNAYCE